MVQNDNISVQTNADEKINSLCEHTIPRYGRKHFECPLNEIKRRTFMSMNSSLGWIGSAASPVCSYYSSYMQQKDPNIVVNDMVEQNSLIMYPRNIRADILPKHSSVF